MTPQQINISDYNYPLPQERIALHPLPDRAACRLLHRKTDGDIMTLYSASCRRCCRPMPCWCTTTPV